MDKKYACIQPEYVGRFQCDGKKCNAKCCRNGWRIPIDEATYKKYSRMKPKSEARRILANITKSDEGDLHLIKPDANGACPFLSDEKLCSIQKKYGADFISNICCSYPRVTHRLGDYCERALLMTCPVALELMLSSSEPLAFEQLELDEARCFEDRTPIDHDLRAELAERVFATQYAAISILQSRNLSLDGRLIVLGFYLDRLDELIEAEQFDEIERLSAVCSSDQFLQSEARQLISSVEFNANAYIKKMFELLDALYGEQSMFSRFNRRYLDAVGDALNLVVDEGKHASISELASNYKKLGAARKNFLERNSIALEHYLVNEFFIGLYPWKLERSIRQNYGAFVATYKILELISLSLDVQWKKWHRDDSEPPKDFRLPTIISTLALNVDHNREYLGCVLEHVGDDTLSIMRSFLDA